MITTNDEHTNPNLAKKTRFKIGMQDHPLVVYAVDLVWISDFRIKFTTLDGSRQEVSSSKGFWVEYLEG